MFRGLIQVLQQLVAALVRVDKASDDLSLQVAGNSISTLRLASSVDALTQQLATASPIPMAERAEPAVRLTIEPKAGAVPIQGGTMCPLAVSMNDGEQFRFSLTPAVKDTQGEQFKNTDGSDLTPDQVPVSWETSDPDKVPLTGIAIDGKTDNVLPSGHPGTAAVTGTIGPYPDGSSMQFVINVAIGFSKPGEPDVQGAVEPEAGGTGGGGQ